MRTRLSSHFLFLFFRRLLVSSLQARTCMSLAAGFFFSTDYFCFRSLLEAAGFLIGFRACGIGGRFRSVMNSASPSFTMSSTEGNALRRTCGAVLNRRHSIQPSVLSSQFCHAGAFSHHSAPNRSSPSLVTRHGRHGRTCQS